MTQLDQNVRYLCETFPELVRRIVLQAKENELKGDVGAVECADGMLVQIRNHIQWWTADASREFRRRLRETERRKGTRGG